MPDRTSQERERVGHESVLSVCCFVAETVFGNYLHRWVCVLMVQQVVMLAWQSQLLHTVPVPAMNVASQLVDWLNVECEVELCWRQNLLFTSPSTRSAFGVLLQKTHYINSLLLLLLLLVATGTCMTPTRLIAESLMLCCSLIVSACYETGSANTYSVRLHHRPSWFVQAVSKPVCSNS